MWNYYSDVTSYSTSLSSEQGTGRLCQLACHSHTNNTTELMHLLIHTQGLLLNLHAYSDFLCLSSRVDISSSTVVHVCIGSHLFLQVHWMSMSRSLFLWTPADAYCHSVYKER